MKTDPYLEIVEGMLLSTMCRDRGVYIIGIDLGLKPWFFRDKDYQDFYKEMMNVIESRSFKF